MSTLSKLKKILPPPRSPIDAKVSTLKAVQKSLGVQFPKDYVELSKVYGSGEVFIENVTSFQLVSAFRKNYRDFVGGFLYKYLSLRQDVESDLPLFPEPGGLLPFAKFDNFYFAWRTVGDPEEWPVFVIHDFDMPWGCEEFKVTSTELILGFLDRSLDVKPLSSLYTFWPEGAEISFDAAVLLYEKDLDDVLLGEA